MLRIGISTDYFNVAADAASGRVARLILHRSAVNFLQLGVINVRTESVLDRLQIGFVSVPW
jgi:hypothetical protein